MGNDYVKIGTHQCPICGEMHSHNAPVLLNKRLKDISDDATYCGPGLCEEHDQMHKDGFIALVGCNNTHDKDTLKEGEADRTGAVAHIKREVFPDIFDSEAPDMPMIFCEQAVIDFLQEKQEQHKTKH